MTKEEVLKIKSRFMELDARPIKKVAEAKARKKMKATKRMEKLKAKAELIAMNQEMTEDAKVKGRDLELVDERREREKEREKEKEWERKRERDRLLKYVCVSLYILSFSPSCHCLTPISSSELERLAKRQQQLGKRPKKQVVVRRNFQNGKGTPGKGKGGKVKCVDRRMLKDRRAMKRAEKAQGKKTSGVKRKRGK